ncbi:hypothetical protein CIHG_07715 [Coccidioides immitis H538.4]|uniref:Uncharacterized protein n=3 Tax=Coccidioides immitis TaxID=5501 RepID=A0A0J8QXL1_COCIT|nr:hypothetical protein CIRG_04187 [Coccidioides immitis RMSCC 2394]KMU76083.1 hypothetical protein CISG_05341 [Coccidioides immitis RMSCC 3703]KMU90031.1 hypothetical protein CIHG_07715 [Coccidioides immitis H538.4]
MLFSKKVGTLDLKRGARSLVDYVIESRLESHMDRRRTANRYASSAVSLGVKLSHTGLSQISHSDLQGGDCTIFNPTLNPWGLSRLTLVAVASTESELNLSIKSALTEIDILATMGLIELHIGIPRSTKQRYRDLAKNMDREFRANLKFHVS